MKTTVPFFTALLFISTLFNCSVNANAAINPLVKEEPKGEYNGCFVQYMDGTIKQFTTLKLVTKVFKTPHLVADDSVIIYAVELKAYQNENGYAVSQATFGTDKKTYVAKDVLPGFAVRVVKGYLNIFSIKYYNGQNTTEKLFVQQNGSDAISLCTPELLETLIKDNSDAVSILSSNNKTLSAAKKLLAAAEVYNSSKLLSKN
jgi:hypothetical protein